jgi:geranylgeranyl reductase family protein
MPIYKYSVNFFWWPWLIPSFLLRVMSATTYDIIITGAGPAGSTCALALKKSGLRVALVDKEKFPRDKICGDAVSSIAKRILRQIDPQLEIDLLDFAPKTNITKAKLYSPAFESIEIAFSKVGHCIRRMDFDHWLFEKACTAHPKLSLYLQQAVKQVIQENGTNKVLLQNGQLLQAPLLIACDGAHSVAAKKLGNMTVNRKHYSGAVRQYYRNIKGLEGNALEVYFLKGFLPGYFWIFPLSNGEANIGFGMLSETIAKQKIDLKQSLKDIINNIPQVAERFEHAEALDEIKGFGLPLGSKKYAISGNGFMLCGDAASLIDPFSGEGIETAMESGKFAAEQAMRCFKEQKFSAKYMKAYDERVYKKMWPNFRNHYILQRFLGKRIWLINSLISIGNIPFINKRIPKLFY